VITFSLSKALHAGDGPMHFHVEEQIPEGAFVALTGPSGAGKTTLLRMLAGFVEADEGEIQVARGTTFGYLPQDGLTHEGRTLFDEVRTGLADLVAMEAEIGRLEAVIEAGADGEDLARYAELQDTFRVRGGFTMDADTARVLKGLGFAEPDFGRPCEQFSGGWQMRIALARLLVQRPNLLLLDEPTNHLDLPARDWLENYLRTYPYAVVLVSHDRWFLDHVVERIVEVWNGGLTEYPGVYSRYIEERDRRVAALQDAKARQDEEIARTQAFIDRFRYTATKASQVQSRVKQLEKVVRIQVPPARRRIVFKFPAPPPCGQPVLTLEGVEQGYGALQVLADVDLTLERGERVALVGANGAGKSTLMRVLSGVEAPRAGVRFEGNNLRMAYFAQDQAKVLCQERTVIEEILAAAPVEMAGRVRDILGAFLFSGDDVGKSVSVLSGGERNRLALAILLLRPANLLLLDEPTNHLDLKSKDVLLESLRAYTGTIVFVSHDRHFVDGLATRILEVGDRKVVSHLGNYSDFLRTKAAEGDVAHQSLRVERKDERPAAPEAVASGEDRRRAHEERKEAQKAQRKRERLMAEAEARVEKLEAERAEVETLLADGDLYRDAVRWRDMTLRYERLKADLVAAYAAWEAIETASDV
jgi:ATP-binding cassette subfamily F protein 3